MFISAVLHDITSPPIISNISAPGSELTLLLLPRCGGLPVTVAKPDQMTRRVYVVLIEGHNHHALDQDVPNVPCYLGI